MIDHSSQSLHSGTHPRAITECRVRTMHPTDRVCVDPSFLGSCVSKAYRACGFEGPSKYQSSSSMGLTLSSDSRVRPCGFKLRLLPVQPHRTLGPSLLFVAYNRHIYAIRVKSHIPASRATPRRPATLAKLSCGAVTGFKCCKPHSICVLKTYDSV